MLPWKIDVVINIVLVVIAFWMRLRTRRRRNLWRLAFAYGFLLVASSLVGIAVGVLVSLDPFAGETFAPEPLSCAATGIMAFLLPTIIALIMYRRSHDESPESVPQ
jgi:hypothetical protein